MSSKGQAHVETKYGFPVEAYRLMVHHQRLSSFTTVSVSLCFGSERDGVRTERHDDHAQAQVEPSCATTKAVEVCVNGVKQIIIIPSALSSNNVTTVSSATFAPGYLSSSSSLSSAVDGLPEDVKLLAESCIQVTSSSSVSSIGKPATFSAPTNVYTHVSPVFTNHAALPSSYRLFNMCRAPLTSSSTEVPRNYHPFVEASPLFGMNSVGNRPTLPSSIIQHPAPSFPAVPGLPTPGVPGLPAPAVPRLPTPALPASGFPPAQQSSNTMSLPTALQQQFSFPPGGNTVLPSQNQPGLNLVPQQRQHALPSYGPPPMGPTAVRNALNYLQPCSTMTTNQTAFDPSLANRLGTDNYRQFLPSLQSTFTRDLPINGPPVTFHDYVLRKRAFLQQNIAHGLQIDAGNYRMSRFDPPRFPGHGMSFQRPPPFCANEIRTSYANAPPNYTNAPNPLWGFTSSHVSQSSANSGTSVTKKAARKPRTVPVSHKRSVDNNSVHPLLLQPSNTSVSNHVTSAVYQTAANETAFMIPNQIERPRNTVSASYHQPAAGISTSMQVTPNVAHSVSVPATTIASAAVAAVASRAMKTLSIAALLQKFTSSSCIPPVSAVPTDLQVSVNQTQPAFLPVTAIATSSVATVATYTTETTCHPTAVMQASAAVESNSSESLSHDTLLFDIGRDLTAASVPSNCSLTSNPSLSNLLSTDLFPLNSVSVPDVRPAVTESDTVQQTRTDLEVGTSQLGDNSNNSNDLESLAADVMAVTAESESLLMSFCDMFEQPDAAHPPSGVVPSLPMSDRVKDGLQTDEQPKGSSIGIQHSERGLEFAKSLGKGRHFAEEMRQRRQEQARGRRRRRRLTSLDVADESNSSDSWRPDGYSESSENRTVSSPAPSSVSQSSEDFVVVTRPAKRQRTMQSKRKRSSRRIARFAEKQRKSAVLSSPHPATKECTVVCERLQLQGQHSVNVHCVDRLFCCQPRRSVKLVKRILSSDSECSPADQPPIKKLRIRICPVEDTDSS